MSKDNLPISKATTADIRSMHDFSFKPSVEEKLYKTYAQGWTMIDTLRKAAGRSGMISNWTMTGEEENFTHRTITLAQNSTNGAGPGDPIDIVLDADDLDSDNNYYPRENFTVMFGDVVNGFIQCRITSIAEAGATITLTVKPYDSTKTLGTISSGTEIAILDSAFAGETNQPDATSVGTVQREFYAQIMKETIGFGGPELDSQRWVLQEGVGLFNKELVRAEFLLDLQEEMALWMGQPNTNSLTQTSAMSGSENTVYKNKGVWTWVDELGGEVTFTLATGVDITDLDEVAEYYESVGVTNDIVFLGLGGKAWRKFENNAVDYFQGSGNLTDKYLEQVDDYMFNGSKGMALKMGFTAVRKSGITFIIQRVPVFSNPKLLGIAGYKLDESGIMFPISTVKEAKSGNMVPNLMKKYVGINGYSRERIVGMIGGMDGFMKQNFSTPIINQVDGNYTYWLSHVMFPFFEAYKGCIIRPSA